MDSSITNGTSACAIYECGTCEYLSTGMCPGCRTGNTQLRDEGREICAVFACVQNAGGETCESCKQSSCTLRRSAESICPLRGRFEKKRWWAGHMSRALEGRTTRGGSEPRISEKVINRLRWYLTAVEQFAADGQESVSSWQLAEKVGVNSSLIRKDLSRFGEFGTPSFGYRIDYLTERLRGILHLDKPRGVVWIGACAFRQMCSVIDRMTGHGCQVLAVFDLDPAEIGANIAGHEVRSLDGLADFVAGHEVHAAALVVPGLQAQSVADTLDQHGVRAILNLSGQLLVLPDRVKVTSIDLAGELLELCYYCEKT